MPRSDAASEAQFDALTASHRRELRVHCYRMLGSFQDAEDAVQDTYLRAWRSFAEFEGRSSVRTWLYRIATRVCLTALESAGRRILPSGLGAPEDDPRTPLAPHARDIPWLQPFPDADDTADPAGILERRESTRLAFIAALQQLPPRQRATLLLRDVLQWPAADVATMLDLSVAAVTSALQRARDQLNRSTPTIEAVRMTVDLDTRLLDQYTVAFETADLEALTALLRHDIQVEMPPTPTWFAGRGVVAQFLDRPLHAGQWRLLPIRANGCPAVASYLARGNDDVLRAHSIQVIEPRDGAIAHLYVFMEPSLFASFGLPTVWSVSGEG